MKSKPDTAESESALDKGVSSRTIPRHVMDAFDNLVPDDAPGQAKASVVILKHVDNDKLISNHTGLKLPDDVVYVVKRLVSGLMSNRQRVREGFCSTLQALLQLQPTTANFAYETLLGLCSSGKKNISKEEARNLMTGELLGYGALIRSGHVKGNTTMRQEIIERLFAIRNKKDYYDIIVSNFFVHMMEKLTKYVINQEILIHLAKEMSIPLEGLTPSKYWLRLVILRKFPDIAPDSITDTLNPKNFSKIGTIIVTTSINMPNVHPCLSETISSLAAQRNSKGGTKVVEFWEKGLAPYLQEPTTNCLQLLFNGLQLVLLKLKTAAEIRQVCNDVVISHLLNVMSLHDKNLSASARGVGSALLQLATTNYENDNSIQLAIARALIEKPGSVRFDQLTGTKLLGQMRMHFTTDTVKKVTKIIRKIILEEEDARTSSKIGGALFLGRLVSQPRMSGPEFDDWRKNQILLLMSLALLKPDMQKTVEEYQEIFFRCLVSRMSRIKDYKLTLQYLYEDASAGVLTAKETSKPLLEPKAQGLWDKISSRLTAMQETDVFSPVASDVFQVLYMQMALYLLATYEAKDIIEELENCYRAARRSHKLSKRTDVDTKDDGWVNKVVELLLTLLPHENTLFRSLAQGIFWLLCPMMTPSALLSVVDVLDPAKQSDLIRLEDDQHNIDEEEDDDDELDEEEDDDLDESIEEEEEEEDTDGANSDEDTEDDMEVEDEWSDEEESENEEDEVLVKLKKEMMAITGNIHDEIDMDSVPQEELDSMDSKLGALVGKHLQNRQKKSLKNKGIEKLQSDERLLMHFRSRICDLLELYLKEGSDMGLLLSLINPLITAIIGIDQDRKRQDELLRRMKTLLLMVGRIQKFDNFGGATIAFVVEELNTFFNSTLKMRDEFNPVIRGCYYLFMRSGFQLLGEEAHNPGNMLIQSYLSHLREMFTNNKFNLRTHTLTDICTNDYGSLWSVAELMKEFGFSKKLKIYWHTQAMQILLKLYRNEALLTRMDAETISEWEKSFASKACQILGPSAPVALIRGHYLVEILGLLYAIRKRELSKKVTDGVNWDEVGSTLVSLRHRVPSKTYKLCRGPFNTIINHLGLSNQIAKPQEIAERRRAEALNPVNIPQPVENNEEDEAENEDSEVRVNGEAREAKRKSMAGKKGKGKAKGKRKFANNNQGQKKKRKVTPSDT